MKKNLFTILLVLMPFCFAAAQTALVPYKWDALGMKFQVPESSDILESSDSKFVVDNPNLRVEIEAYEGLNFSSDEMAEAVMSLAEEQGIIYDESTEVQQFSNSGLQGFSLEGNRDGDGIAVALLLSERSDITAAVTVIYGDGLEDVANDIINSFTMSK